MRFNYYIKKIIQKSIDSFVTKMIQQEKDKIKSNIGSLYIDRNVIGIAYYSTIYKKIQSSKINFYFSDDVKKIAEIFKNCQIVLTNNCHCEFFRKVVNELENHQKIKQINNQKSNFKNMTEADKEIKKVLQKPMRKRQLYTSITNYHKSQKSQNSDEQHQNQNQSENQNQKTNQQQKKNQSSSLSIQNNYKQKIKIIQIKQNGLQISAIQNNLYKLPKQNLFNLKSFKTLIQGMKIQKQRFKAIGAIVYHLLSNDFNVNNIIGNDNQNKIFFEDIQFIYDSLLYTVIFQTEDLEHLEIAKVQMHPSALKGNGKNKQGFSILALFQNFINSSLGKKINKKYMMNPIYNIKQIQKRQNNIIWIQNNFDIHGDQNFAKIFKKLHSIEKILKKIQNGSANPQQLKKILNVAKALVDLRSGIINSSSRPSKNIETPELIKRFINYPQWQKIRQLYSAINNSIDFCPFGIKNGYDDQLDKQRYLYANLADILTLQARKTDYKFPFQIVFFAQMGYMLKISHENKIPQEALPQNWILEFTNSTGNFFSNQLTQLLDEKYGDLYGKIQDIQQQILFSLSNFILQSDKALIQLYWIGCQIDCFWGLARICQNMAVPKLSSQALIVSNSWYPLLGQKYIDNHIFSFNHFQQDTPYKYVSNHQENLVNTQFTNRCMLISGPNGSGKTVYLKQLTTIIYLAHVGYLVPAQFAEIPLIDRIITTKIIESVSNQSTGYVKELQKLKFIINKGLVTNRSLVLIDQLGSQCAYQVALKILYGTVRNLISNKITNPLIQQELKRGKLLLPKQKQLLCPISIIITHLTQMLTSKLLSQDKLLRHITLDFQDNFHFLYKIKPGVVKSRYGIEIASKLFDQQEKQFIEKMKKYRQKLDRN